MFEKKKECRPPNTFSRVIHLKPLLLTYLLHLLRFFSVSAHPSLSPSHSHPPSLSSSPPCLCFLLSYHHCLRAVQPLSSTSITSISLSSLPCLLFLPLCHLSPWFSPLSRSSYSPSRFLS